jgi:hypothetical protein
MKSASRTLVKSPPEIWELLDQPERMQGLMSSLVGHATEIKVYERDPEAYLGWEARDDGQNNWIEVEMGEKGWGTHVKVTASAQDGGTKLEGWLEAVMEELSTPEKRPFDGQI